MLKGRAEVDSKDGKYGWTPLSWAAYHGHLEVEKWLVLEGRADVDSAYGETPLSWAAKKGRLEVVKWLVAEGRAEADSMDWAKRTPLTGRPRMAGAEGRSRGRLEESLRANAENDHLKIVKWPMLKSRSRY